MEKDIPILANNNIIPDVDMITSQATRLSIAYPVAGL